MSTVTDLKARIEELEAALRQRDEKLAALRAECDEANQLVDEQREHIDDMDATQDRWIDAFNMRRIDGTIALDPNHKKLLVEHVRVLNENKELIRELNSITARYNGTARPVGRPLEASEAQVLEVLKLYIARTSQRKIAAATGLSVKTVRSIIAQKDRERQTRKRLFDKARVEAFRAKKRMLDQLPARLTEERATSDRLRKAAKGLGSR